MHRAPTARSISGSGRATSRANRARFAARATSIPLIAAHCTPGRFGQPPRGYPCPPQSQVRDSDIGVPCIDRDRPRTAPGAIALRAAPPGMPATDLQPPVLAESGDPFTALRVIDLVARLERGRPVRLDDLVDQLNAAHLDWLFTRARRRRRAAPAPGELDGRLPQCLRHRARRRRPVRRRRSPSRTRAASTRGSCARPSATSADAQERLRAFSRLDRATRRMTTRLDPRARSGRCACPGGPGPTEPVARTHHQAPSPPIH